LQEKEIEINRLRMEANMRLQSHITQSSEFAKFQQENISLHEEIEKLRGTAGGKSEQIGKLNSKNTIWEEKVGKLEEKVKELEGENVSLKKKISETSEKNSQELREKNRKLKDLSSQLEKSLEDAEISRIDLGKISSQLSEEKNLSAKNEILKKEISTLKGELLEKNTNLRDISAQLEEAFSSAEIYQIELDKFRREISEKKK